MVHCCGFERPISETISCLNRLPEKGSRVCGRRRSRGEFRPGSRHQRHGVQIQMQGLHDLLAVGIAHRLQWRAATECRHLMVNPVLGLLLDDFLKPPLCLRIAAKGLLELLTILRLRLGSFGSFREHLVGRLRRCALVRNGSTKPPFDLSAEASGAICGIHFRNQGSAGNFDIPEDGIVPTRNPRVALPRPVKFNALELPSLPNFASSKSSSFDWSRASGARASNASSGDSMRNFSVWNTSGSPSVLANRGGVYSPSRIVRYLRRIASWHRTRSAGGKFRVFFAVFPRSRFLQPITPPLHPGAPRIGSRQPPMAKVGRSPITTD